MAHANTEPYVFKHLVEADAESAAELSTTLKTQGPVAFSRSNATGVLPSMTFEEAGARASNFGARCRQVMLDKSTH